MHDYKNLNEYFLLFCKGFLFITSVRFWVAKMLNNIKISKYIQLHTHLVCFVTLNPSQYMYPMNIPLDLKIVLSHFKVTLFCCILHPFPPHWFCI